MQTLDSLDRQNLIKVLAEMKHVCGERYACDSKISDIEDKIASLECQRKSVNTKRTGLKILFIMAFLIIFNVITMIPMVLSMFFNLPESVQNVFSIIRIPGVFVLIALAIIAFKKIKNNRIKKEAIAIAEKESRTINVAEEELLKTLSQLKAKKNVLNAQVNRLFKQYCVQNELQNYKAICDVYQYILSNSRASIRQATDYAIMNAHNEAMESYAREQSKNEAERNRILQENNDRMYEEQKRHNNSVERSNRERNERMRRDSQNIEVIRDHILRR